MHINDRSKTDFDRAKIKLTGHFDWRPTGRYFEPSMQKILTFYDGVLLQILKMFILSFNYCSILHVIIQC